MDMNFGNGYDRKNGLSDGALHQFVSVRFRNSDRTYDYLADGFAVAIGDIVNVVTKRGEQQVEVEKVFWSDAKGLPLPFSSYKSIVGKADVTDVKDESKRFVHVIFNSTSYKYSYACPDESIGVGDFVFVMARGQEKFAKIVDVYTSAVDNYRPVLGRATERQIKENIFEFLGDDEYRDESAYDMYNKPNGYHDYDLDEDDYALLTYVEVYLPEYKHTDKYRYEDMELVKGDVVVVDTMVGTAEGVVKNVFYELQKHSSEDLCMMREVLYKVRDNPNTVQRIAALEKQDEKKWKLEDKASRGLEAGWKRVKRHEQELDGSFNPIQFAKAAIASGAAYTVTTSQQNSSGQYGPTQQELLTSPEYWWHPMNLYYDEDKATDIDHNRMVDDNGYMINGKWLAEHERNAGPGVYDSRGFAKSPAYEEALKDNFYLEEETGDHTYDDPGDYVDSSSSDDSCFGDDE